MTNPATGDINGTAARADPADLDRALAAVQRGFATWRRMSAHDRGKIMRRAAPPADRRSAVDHCR